MAKGNKNGPRKMVMKRSDVTVRLRLLAMWDFQCVLCGHPFRDISSVTFEHLTPKSLGAKRAKKKRCGENFGPSHYNCNQFRQNFSLCRAMRLLDRHRKRLGERGFVEWINKAVPNRIVAPEFMQVPTNKPDIAATLFGVLIPEWLPGMT